MFPADEPIFVFVYGTLLAQEANHGLLQRARFLGPAHTLPAFDLHDLGAFPAIVAGGTTAILGEVYQVDAPTLAALDDLEEHPRYYQRTRITLADGRQAWTYILDRAHVSNCPIIASGSWRAHRT
jgi:gamma-glutamylaminecyclotransferase